MSAIGYATSTLEFFQLNQLPVYLEPLLGPVAYQKNYLSAVDVELSFERVADVVRRARFAPIMSCNRVDGRISFTVVPYGVPSFFAKDVIEAPEEMKGSALWDRISTITSLYREGAPVVWRGREFRDKLEYWGAFASRASQDRIAHPIVSEAIAKYPAGSVALDIGAGKGAEAIGLCGRGWQVYVVERSREAIAVLVRNCLEIPETDAMQVQCACISEFDFPIGRYHVVLAYDVLPYVDFAKMKSIFQGVFKSLLSGGRFVGTFFFTRPGDPFSEARRLNGIYLLPDPRMVPGMIKDSGLLVETIRYRYHADQALSEVVEFSCLKP
ncbi:MAG: class I SAM-dependent methyltransferase [Chlamydiae bacterium]|nr:class I SAM-dependent methyltransferase [Chlamydiota bacterium]